MRSYARLACASNRLAYFTFCQPWIDASVRLTDPVRQVQKVLAHAADALGEFDIHQCGDRLAILGDEHAVAAVVDLVQEGRRSSVGQQQRPTYGSGRHWQSINTVSMVDMTVTR